MANDTDEYQFNEDELNTIENTPVNNTRQRYANNILQRFSMKHILGVLGLLALIWIGYIITTALIARHHRTKAIEALASSTTVAKPTIPHATQPASPAVVNNVSSAEMDVLKSKFAQLNDQMNKQRDTIEGLNFSLSQLQAQSTVTNELLQKLNAQWTAQQAKEQAAEAAKKKPKIAAKPVEKITYYVKAMVPGRAWLQSSKGNAITVRVGDMLPDAGKIAVMNIDQGIVVTNNGTVIEYKPDDH